MGLLLQTIPFADGWKFRPPYYFKKKYMTNQISYQKKRQSKQTMSYHISPKMWLNRLFALGGVYMLVTGVGVMISENPQWGYDWKKPAVVVYFHYFLASCIILMSTCLNSRMSKHAMTREQPLIPAELLQS